MPEHTRPAYFMRARRLASILLGTATMRRFLCVSVVAVVSLLVVGCNSGPNEVRSSSYDQSCSVSADCALVSELSVDGSDCFMGCGADGVVSKRAEADYRRDLDTNAKECDRMPGLDCAPSKIVAECAQGKCTLRSSTD